MNPSFTFSTDIRKQSDFFCYFLFSNRVCVCACTFVSFCVCVCLVCVPVRPSASTVSSGNGWGPARSLFSQTGSSPDSLQCHRSAGLTHRWLQLVHCSNTPSPQAFSCDTSDPFKRWPHMGIYTAWNVLLHAMDMKAPKLRIWPVVWLIVY